MKIIKSRPGRATGRRGCPVAARTAAAAALFLALTAGLSGCLLNRVVEVRQQFCDFDRHFEVHFGERPGVSLLRPVLLDSDITWLAGTAPTAFEKVPDGLIMAYQIEEAVPKPDPGRDIRVDFRFVLLDGAYRLEGINLDPKLSTVLNRDFLDHQTLLESAQNICQTRWGFGSTSLELDITDQQLELLPDRAELHELLGPPHALSDGGSGWIYGYRLKGSPEDGDSARFTIWFDDAGGKPLRLESSWSRYRTSADFEAKKLSMNVKL